MKPKKCRQCKKPFDPSNSMQIVCDPHCAYEYAKAKEQKKFNKRTRELKKEVKTKGKYTKEAQAVFNKWIRLRDVKQPCISCQRHHAGQYHAGHYRTTGANPELRFEPFNVHKQCAPCNNHLSGNLVNYRINLIDKIGIKAVEWLEGPHEAKNYSIDDLIEIKRYYREQSRLLEKAAA